MIDVGWNAWTRDGLDAGERFLARAVETSADGVIIVGSDDRVMFLNAAAERLLGLPRDPVTGRPHMDADLELLASTGEPLAVEDRPTTQVSQTGQPVYDLEAQFERPDGRRVVLWVNASPLPGTDGETSAVVMSLRDASVHKQTEETLRRQTAVLRAQAELLDLVHDAIFVRDLANSVIHYWNRGAEEIYGYRWDDAVGKVSHELLQTQFPRPLAEIEDIMLHDGRWEGELVQRTLDGHQVIIESRWVLQRNPHGEPIAFLEVNRDITARKHTQGELARQVGELRRVNDEIAHRHREMEAVNRSIAAVSQALDLREVLQNIVDAARDLLHARYAALGVADGHGRITQFITSGITPEQRAAIGPLPEGHGLLGALIKDGTPLRVRSIAQDPRSHGFPPNHPPMTSLLGVPILFHGRAVGDLYLTDKIDADEFDADDQNLLSLLGGHAAVAIKNAELYEDVRAARDQVQKWNRSLEATVAERTQEIERLSRETTARIFQAQEEERGRIARELHDETAQSLSRLLIDIDLMKPHLSDEGAVADDLTRVERGVKRMLDDVRALSHDLRPAILEDFGVAAAIRAYADDWMQTFGVPIQVDVDRGPDDRLPPAMETALFRVAQEAMMNAGKYARAGNVRVTLALNGDAVHLEVQDDGVGFDPEALAGPSRHSGLGLFGMRERAALLGGSLSIESAPGRGTTVTLSSPMP